MVSGRPPCQARSQTLQASTPTTGHSKYGLSRSSFLDLSSKNIPTDVAKDLEDLGRHGLAKKTWASYATAERLLWKFHKDHNLKAELPISEDTTLRFIHWLATERNLKAGTINSYLAGIRQLHVAKGMPEPAIRTDTINLILKGLKNNTLLLF